MLRDLHRSEHIINKAWIPFGAVSIHYSIMYPQKNWPTYKLAGSQKSHPHPPLNQNPTPWLETGPVDTCGTYTTDTCSLLTTHGGGVLGKTKKSPYLLVQKLRCHGKLCVLAFCSRQILKPPC